MVTQCFILPEWKWKVVAFYDCGPDDADEVLDTMARIGCKGRQMRSAEDLLCHYKPDRGVTFTNYRRHASVMIIGRTSSAREFSNSYDHEKGHLVEHISEALKIPTGSEEKQYLAGAIAYDTFPYAQPFLCDHCRKHLSNRAK